MGLHFSTKARTLAALKDLLQSARVASLYCFDVKLWAQNPSVCLDKIFELLGRGPYIVRSSCSLEDNNISSNAGAFLSLLSVNNCDLRDSIDRVIASYEVFSDANEVLIQPMLSNVVRSGVVFSHDPNTCSPYRIVNWSEGSNTSSVTGGVGGSIWHQAAHSKVSPPPTLQSVLALVDEVLVLFDGEPVDCEFAITLEDEVEMLWLLQARPLILSCHPESADTQSARIEIIEQKVARGMQSHPFLFGRRTVYGVMPDWNPAEIIGIRPTPLALSLYRELITDSIWAYQRHNYGYRNLRSFPLMPHFFGLPYIDVRLSFNSFIPADLDEGLAGRLVDYYIDRLLSEPTLHDKVEFEIVFSCYTLDLPQRLETLYEAGFSKHELGIIANSLRKLTNRIVDPKEGLWRSDAAKIEILTTRRDKLLKESSEPLERIYWLLEDAKRYGTLPFAGLARAGFVAVQMLRSLKSVGIFSQTDCDCFIRSVSTVSGQLSRDRSTLDKATFMSRYGHLRPGTYDILSPRYDEAPDLYFDWNHTTTVPDPIKPFAMTLPQMREVAKFLEAHGLHPDVVGLLDFIQAGIEMRELSKFHFSRNLSDVLALVAQVGNKFGFTREDLAYCDIGVFKELHVAAIDPKEALSCSINQGKARYTETLKIALPPLIVSPEDVWAFASPKASPNFITQKHVTGDVVLCDQRDKLAGSIVCIQHADPGFDWLFAYSIAGLITAWGGVNSHMAIRAGELGLPAVIGSGEVLYCRWSAAQRLHLDCAGRRVEVLL